MIYVHRISNGVISSIIKQRTFWSLNGLFSLAGFHGTGALEAFDEAFEPIEINKIEDSIVEADDGMGDECCTERLFGYNPLSDKWTS